MNTDYDITDDMDYDFEPSHIWKDENGRVHVEVEEDISEYCIWQIKGGRMIKKYDRNLIPF